VTPDGRPRQRGFSTRALRAASQVPQVDQHPTAVPIYQSATFSTDDADELAAVLGNRRPGFAYSRIDNPTVAALDAAVAELEGAEAGFSLATGMAAIHATLISLVKAGDRIVAPLAVYGSTRSLLVNVLVPLGVRIDFVARQVGSDLHAEPADVAVAVEARVVLDPARRVPPGSVAAEEEDVPPLDTDLDLVGEERRQPGAARPHLDDGFRLVVG